MLFSIGSRMHQCIAILELCSCIYLLLFLYTPANGLIAYDCSSTKSQVTEISLVDSGSCTTETKNITTRDVEIQLIQPLIFTEVKYYQCQIEIDHFIFRCGKSIDTNYESGVYEELMKLEREECITLVKNRFLYYNGFKVEVPRDTELYYVSLTTHGSIQSGSCNPGAPLSMNGVFYDRPVRLSKFKILLRTATGTVDVEENKLITEEGAKCKYSDYECMISQGGNTFWDPYFNSNRCDEENKVVIFQGLATETSEYSEKQDKNITSYILHYENYDFQVYTTGKITMLCGSPLHLTDHPKLSIIIKGNNYEFPLKYKKDKIGKNISLMTYINSKLVYSHNHIKEQVENLYNRLSYSKCLTETKLISSILSSAMYSPHDFAYQYYNEEGYTASVRGEVVYIMKCEAVSVNYTAEIGDCYQEVPVTRNGKQLFMSPRSRLLSAVGTKAECSSVLPIKYKLGESWYHVSSSGMFKTNRPQTMTISDQRNWKFVDVENLANSGIYSPDELEKIDKVILTSLRNDAITNQISRAITGDSTLSKGMNLKNMMTVDDIETFGKSKMNQIMDSIWKKLGIFGNIVATLIGLLVIIKMILFILNSLINIKILWNIFGFSWKLIFFWWSHLVNLLMHSKKRSKEKKEEDDKDNYFSESEKMVLNDQTYQI